PSAPPLRSATAASGTARPLRTTCSVLLRRAARLPTATCRVWRQAKIRVTSRSRCSTASKNGITGSSDPELQTDGRRKTPVFFCWYFLRSACPGAGFSNQGFARDREGAELSRKIQAVRGLDHAAHIGRNKPGIAARIAFDDIELAGI